MTNITKTNVPWALIASCALLISAATVGPHYLRPGHVSPLTNPADFRAFYCAGKVVAGHKDPITIEPLRTCEHDAIKQAGLEPVPLMVNAAPQPPYSLILFSGLNFMPFPAAGCFWFALLLICTIGTVAILQSLTQLALPVISLVVVCGNLLAFMSGELGPIVIFSLVLSARSVSQDKPMRAAGYAAIASVVPHIALPAWVALYVYTKGTRRWLGVTIVVLAVVPLTVFGTTVWANYFTKELPAHALSEIHALMPQYSLSMVLAFLGLPDYLAIASGQIQYFAMLVLGVIVARKLSIATKRSELIVLIPTAFTALGGAFIHLYQLVIIFPAAMCLMSNLSLKLRPAMVFAISGVLVSMGLDLMFASSTYSPLTADFAVEMKAMKSSDLASAAMKYWHENQLPTDTRTICLIFLLKVPAVFGTFVFVVTACRAAFRRDPCTKYLQRSSVPQ